MSQSEDIASSNSEEEEEEDGKAKRVEKQRGKLKIMKGKQWKTRPVKKFSLNYQFNPFEDFHNSNCKSKTKLILEFGLFGSSFALLIFLVGFLLVSWLFYTLHTRK